MDIHAFLAMIWYLLLGFILILYVISDGFDLGVGILVLLERDEGRRAEMMAGINGIWDANETWLVLFGGALFGAFPAIYAAALHALYIPVSLMLFGLILRGAAFGFRAHARDTRPWTLAFGVGSLLAALAQGYALGGVIGGLPVDGAQAAGIGSWPSPFPAIVSAGVAAGYALLGGTFMIMKTRSGLQVANRRRSRYAAWIMLSAAAFVTIATPASYGYVGQRWFSMPDFVFLAPLPAIALAAAFLLLRSLERDCERAPFVWTLVIFLASFVGLTASLYPYLIPTRLTLDDAAASSPTLVFMLVGIGMLIPIMLVYNGYQYRVFRGRVPRGPRVAMRRAEPPGAVAPSPFNYRSHADSSRWTQG